MTWNYSKIPFIFSNENIEKPFYIAFKCFDAICTWCLCVFNSIYTSNIFIERKITPSLFAGWNKSFALLSKSYKSFTLRYLYKVVNVNMHFGSDNRWCEDASFLPLKVDNHFKVQHLLSSIFDLTFERCFWMLSIMEHSPNARGCCYHSTESGIECY